MPEEDEACSEDEVFFDAPAQQQQQQQQHQHQHQQAPRRSTLSALADRRTSLNDAFASRRGTPAFTTAPNSHSNSTTHAPLRSRSLPRRDTRGRSPSRSSPREAVPVPVPVPVPVDAAAALTSAVPAVPEIPQQYRNLLRVGPPLSVSSLSRANSTSSRRRSPPASASATTTSTTITTNLARRPSSPRLTSRSPTLVSATSPRDHCAPSGSSPEHARADRVSTSATRDPLPAPEDQPPSSPRSSTPSPTAHQDVHTLSQLEGRAPPHPGLQNSTAMSTHSAHSRTRPQQRDLFLEVAADQMPEEDDSLAHLRRSASRFSQANKRRSLPADVLPPSSDRRPSTSGNSHARPTSRLLGNSRVSTDLQRHMDQYNSPIDRTSIQFDGPASVSGRSASGPARRFSVAPERSPVSPSIKVRSPDVSPYVRGRQSLSVIASSQHRHTLNPILDPHEESSPAESSVETKQTDSASADSQTADTVWDELDDLKLRIKQLELTGKMPATSNGSGATSGDSSERPRTATTAPTTIDSSPKQERKREPAIQETPTPPPPAEDSAAGPASTAKVHPSLHSALAKAKPLLNSSLFNTLEATINDALQLAAMTGGQGASLQNGVVSDRHVRRKADTMCRNLTDLCLALCEGKHDPASIALSPSPVDTSMQHSPSLRYSSSNLSQRIASAGRPMSRLEARRSSILGVPAAGSVESISPRGSFGDAPAQEQDSTPTHYPTLRRISRAPSNLLRSRVPPSDEPSVDDDPTIRPPSRAMTDIGALRKARNQADDRSPGPQRTPSLRETLSARRAKEGAFESNSFQTPPHSADTHRRRLYEQQQSTPPVVEEEDSPNDYEPSSQPPRRRITYSTGHFLTSRATGDFPSRPPSLNSRRQLLVE